MDEATFKDSLTLQGSDRNLDENEMNSSRSEAPGGDSGGRSVKLPSPDL